MRLLSRRGFVLASAALGAVGLESPPVYATLVRGLTLHALVTQSRRIIVLQPLESYSHVVTLGGRRSIVTDTRIRIEDVVAKEAPSAPELLVRTLGGRVGRVGELVHGQAEIEAGGLSLAFLTTDQDGAHWVMGMAQGHYPIEGLRSQARLRASRNLPVIREFASSAVRALAGQPLHAARATIRELAR